MSRLPFSTVVAACIGIACLSLPVFASEPTTVTFKADTPWTQEIGSVQQYQLSNDYTVAVAADKTLQINLVTRNPNVFFKVRDDTDRKDLIDTYKNGATTWSTKNATAATYTIHVYAQPGTMQQGEVAKYALQIGQYGQSDMQPATTAVQFENGRPWVQAMGTLDAQGTARDYTVAIGAGQTLAVNLIAHDPKVHFKVEDKDNGQTLVDSATAPTTNWTTPVNTATNYTISVFTDPAALPPGNRVGYALQIGRYAQGGTQAAAPAGAGSAGAPPAPTAPTAPPAAAASANG